MTKIILLLFFILLIYRILISNKKTKHPTIKVGELYSKDAFKCI